jgi:hypothetical protein
MPTSDITVWISVRIDPVGSEELVLASSGMLSRWRFHGNTDMETSQLRTTENGDSTFSETSVRNSATRYKAPEDIYNRKKYVYRQSELLWLVIWRMTDVVSRQCHPSDSYQPLPIPAHPHLS